MINKKDKGITLVSLVITVALMIIIASTTVYVSVQRFEINKYRKLLTDLELLNDKVSNYYLNYSGLPVLRDGNGEPIEYTGELNFEKNENDKDTDKYYIIDLSVLSDITLNYGKEGFENPNESDDVYIINEQTHTIYYVKGIKFDGEIYHYIKKDMLKDSNIGPTKPQINVLEGELVTIDNVNYYRGIVKLEFIPGKSSISDIVSTTYSIDNGQETDINELENNVYIINNKNKTTTISLTTTDANGDTSTLEQAINTLKDPNIRMEPEEPTSVYASLRPNSDGTNTYTLIFKESSAVTDGDINLGKVSDTAYTSSGQRPWKSYATSITQATIEEEIKPKSSTAYWFYGLTNLTTINNLDLLYTNEVTNMGCMFYNCSSLTSLDLFNFNTSKVTNMASMFESCSKLISLNLSNFNTSKVTSMNRMFVSCSAIGQIDFSNFDTSNVQNMDKMFRGCSNITELNLNNLETNSLKGAISEMFSGCSKLERLDLSNFNTSQVTDMTSLFSGCSSLGTLNLENLNTNLVTTMNSMFSNCSNLSTINLSTFDTTNVTSMSCMFSGCSKLEQIDLSSFNTTNVQAMDRMFRSCSNLTEIDLSELETNSINSIYSMFSGCSKITQLDLSNFNTSEVKDFSSLFSGCSSLTIINLTNFNTSNATSMGSLFENCSKLESIDLSSFNTSNVTTMSHMFSGCKKLGQLNLSNFDLSKVSNTYRMFRYCYYINTSLNVNGTGVTDYREMFKDAATQAGACITVNYTTATSDLVDNMITTKSATSNVVKAAAPIS